MLICIAGKNNIAVDAAAALVRMTEVKNKAWRFVGLPNHDDDGIDHFQRSYKKWLIDHHIPVVSLEELYGEQDLLFLSLEFNRIINPELFMSKRLYNLHFSLLPNYRGMYTSALPILHGEPKTGVTLHKIDRGIDTGDIIAQKAFSILPDDTCRDLYLKYIKYGTLLIQEYLTSLLTDSVHAIPQDAGAASYFSKSTINYQSLSIDLKQCAVNIRNQVRAYSFREYQMPKIRDIQIIDCKITPNKSFQKSGYVHFIDERSVYISTIDFDCVLYRDRFAELLEACADGNLSVVQDICVVRRHIHEKDEHGWTALMIAVYNNRIDVAKFLLSCGADIFDVNNHGTNLLMYSKEAWVKCHDAALFELFMGLGLNMYQADFQGKSLADYCIEENIPEIGKYKITPPRVSFYIVYEIFLCCHFERNYDPSSR